MGVWAMVDTVWAMVDTVWAMVDTVWAMVSAESTVDTAHTVSMVAMVATAMVATVWAMVAMAMVATVWAMVATAMVTTTTKDTEPWALTTTVNLSFLHLDNLYLLKSLLWSSLVPQTVDHTPLTIFLPNSTHGGETGNTPTPTLALMVPTVSAVTHNLFLTVVDHTTVR